MAAGSLLFIKDMMKKRLSCSSAASTAVLNIRTAAAAAAAKEYGSMVASKKKQEEEDMQMQMAKDGSFSSSRFLLNSSRLQSSLMMDEDDTFPDAQAQDLQLEPRPASPAPAASRDGDDPTTMSITRRRTQAHLQVVVLRVSLHCKGCAAKLKKHISRMQGVTSFHIDIATKKVTVVGDVTPLAVLAAVSKLRPAHFWPSPDSPPRASASF